MEKTNTSSKHYTSLDGLRTIACICIVIMHIMYNNSYSVRNPFVFKVIDSFADFVFLFMVISAFGLCCGYQERILKGQISLPLFYKKRYKRILPFFTLLVLLDLVMEFSRENVYEAIADISLTFGLFPNNITVIGVGWFLGVIFAFYMLFPFFCCLVETKKKAWTSLTISFILNYIGGSYFGLDRYNVVFCACFFFAGALIYLYRNEIERIPWYFSVTILVGSIVIYYLKICVFTEWLVSAMFLVFALGKGGKLLSNKFFTFFSGISMEVYLAHMVIFRVIEKAHLNTIISNDNIQYCFTVVIVLVGTVIFALIVREGLQITERYITKRIFLK